MPKDAVQTNLLLDRKVREAAKRILKPHNLSLTQLIEQLIRRYEAAQRQHFTPEEDALYMRGELTPEQWQRNQLHRNAKIRRRDVVSDARSTVGGNKRQPHPNAEAGTSRSGVL